MQLYPHCLRLSDFEQHSTTHKTTGIQNLVDEGERWLHNHRGHSIALHIFAFAVQHGMLGRWNDIRPGGREVCGVGTKIDKVEITTLEARCTAKKLVLSLDSMTYKKGGISTFEATVGSKDMRKKLGKAIKDGGKLHATSPMGKRQAKELGKTLGPDMTTLPPDFIEELEESKRLMAALDMVDIDVGFMHYHEAITKPGPGLCGGQRARYAMLRVGEDGKPAGADVELLRKLAQRMVDNKEVVLTVGHSSMGGYKTVPLVMCAHRHACKWRQREKCLNCLLKVLRWSKILYPSHG